MKLVPPYCEVTQLVEWLTINQLVVGSRPTFTASSPYEGHDDKTTF